MSGLSTIRKAKNLWVFADQAVVSGSNFFVAIVLSRILGLEGYGRFVLIWMGVLFMSSIQQSLIIQPYFTLRSRKENVQSYVNDLLIIQLGFSLLVLIVAFLISMIYPPALIEGLDAQMLRWISVCASVFLLQDLVKRMVISEISSKWAIAMDIVAFGMQPIIWIIGSSLMSWKLIHVLSSMSLLLAISALIGFVLLKPNFVEVRWRQTIKEHWSFGKYLFGTSILQWFSGNYFILLAAPILGAAAVGGLRLIQNLLGLLHVIFQALENLVPNHLAFTLKKKGHQEMLNAFWSQYAQYGIITAVLLLFLAVFGKPLLGLLYGVENQDLISLVYVYCLIYVLIYSGTMLRFLLRTLEQNHVIFKVYILTTAFSLIFAVPMVKSWGLSGVLAGLLIVQVLIFNTI